MRTKTGWVVVITFILLLFFQSFSLAVSNILTKNILVTYRGIQVIVDGKKISGEEPFVMEGKGIVMVPVRTVSQAVGKSVEWDGKKNIIYIGTAPFEAKNSGTYSSSVQPMQKIIPVTYRGIKIYAGGKIINGEEPFILNKKGIVMVPIRVVAEAIGKTVVWDGKRNTIEITTGKGVVKNQTKQFVWLEDMTVIRNIGPFFRQKYPFTIAAGTHRNGLGVRLTEGTAEIVVRTHGKYKAIEGWLGVDDETANSSGAFFFTIFTDTKEVPSNVETEGGAEKIIDKIPNQYDYDYNLVNMEFNDEDDNIYKTNYHVNSDLFEKTPIYISGPILPASYPKYISPGVTDISGALTVTIRVTWVAGEKGNYPDLTAVLADFKFIK